MFNTISFKVLFFHQNLLFVQNDVASNLSNRLAILIIAMIIAYVSRFILIRFMNRWMMSKSSKVDKKAISETPDQEVVHNQKLAFEYFNSETETIGIASERKTLVERSKKMMKLQFTTDLLIILVYSIVGIIVFENFIFNYEFDMPFALSYFLYIVLFLIWTTFGQLGYRHQFTAYKDSIFDVVGGLWKFVFSVFQSKWKFLISLALLLIALTNAVFSISFDFMEGALMLLAVAFHIYMMVRLNNKAKKQSNLTLLILRVFLIKKTSLFTFSRLAKFWKHFGSYFTVADPSFYKVYWKRNFKHSFPIVMVVIFLFYTQLENSGPSPFGPFIFLMIIGAMLFIFWSIRSMKRNFVQNGNALQTELTRLKNKPVKLDGTFKETPLSCYDNTWQLTVETLVETASVVLMDLRGFSEKNKGCEFEVNLLLNKISLDRILFIGYADTMPLIKSTIELKFETLDAASPNKDIKKPIATLFEVKNENNKEIQYIMDLLLNKAMS